MEFLSKPCFIRLLHARARCKLAAPHERCINLTQNGAAGKQLHTSRPMCPPFVPPFPILHQTRHITTISYDHQNMSSPEPHFNNEVDHRLVVHPPTGLLVQVPVDHRTDPPSPRDELLCKYKGSRCDNPRSLKRNGELHSLCEFHRERANATQSRFDARLRQRRDQTEEMSDLPEPIRTSEDSPTPPLNEWEAELLLKTIEDSN